jgi:hypothetical protein
MANISGDSSIEKDIHAERYAEEAPEKGNLSAGPFKYNRKGILLDPQPSYDPHDPLNFSAWEKGCVLVALAFWAYLGTTNLIIVVSQVPLFEVKSSRTDCVGCGRVPRSSRLLSITT